MIGQTDVGPPLPWWRDDQVCRQLPLLYRAYAWYAALAGSIGFDKGAGFLFRLVGRLHTTVLNRSAFQLIEVDGAPIYVDVTDRRLFWVLDELRLETDEKRVLRDLLGSGDTFVDIGANHGSYSVMVSKFVGASGFVVAFEPQPRLSRLVHESLVLAKRRNFRVFDCACLDRETDVELYIPWRPYDGSGSAGLHRRLSATHRSSVVVARGATLDSCLYGAELPGRMVLKIDVEGSELAVLRGARETIRRRRPPILIEVNAQSAAAAGTSPELVLDLLEELGYSRFAEVDEYPAAKPRAKLADLSRQRNLLALHRACPPR